MTETKHRPNKRALLKDLEDIRASLSDEEFENDIPILTDSIADAEASPEAPGASGEKDKTFFDEKLIFEDVAPETPVSGEVDEYIDELDSGGDHEATLRAPDVLEGQRSLFEEDINQTGIRQSVSVPDETSAPVLPSAVGDNPFLPKHIRDRLTKGKNSFLEEIALINESLNRSSAKSDDRKPEIRAPQKPAPQKSASQGEDYQQVVDDLVAEFLPRIESALRQRLTQILAEKEK